jgi:EAL domain-containing protein (putative c-di-GMP-specific phosphodiesterase class I)
VAEFVDRVDLLESLRRMGVDQAKGYLLGRPEPIEKTLGALVTSRPTAAL